MLLIYVVFILGKVFQTINSDAQLKFAALGNTRVKKIFNDTDVCRLLCIISYSFRTVWKCKKKQNVRAIALAKPMHSLICQMHMWLSGVYAKVSYAVSSITVLILITHFRL